MVYHCSGYALWERRAGYWCAGVNHLLRFHAGLDGEGQESLLHGVLWNTTAWAELCGASAQPLVCWGALIALAVLCVVVSHLLG